MLSRRRRSIHNFRSPLAPANRDQVTQDGHTALVEWDMNGTQKAAEKRIDPLTSAVAAVAKAHPKFYVGEAGDVSSDKALNKLFNQQLGQAGTRSVPLTLLILVLVFGSLLAAFVPLMLALQSVVATIGLVAIVSHLTPMDQSVGAVVTLVGLAVGVDYSLFYLQREREERAAGRSERRRAAGRRCHLGAIGADLGRDRHDRDGRDAVLRRQDVRVVLDRDDDRGRRGDARLADRAAGGALQARRPGREGTDPADRPAPPPVRRRTGSGRPCSPRCSGIRRVAAVLAAGLLAVLAIPTLQIHTAQSGRRPCPAARRRSRRSTGSRRPSPASRARRSSPSRPTPARRRSTTRSVSLRRGPPPAVSATARRTSTRTGRTPRLRSRSRCPAAAPTGPRPARCSRCAITCCRRRSDTSPARRTR